MSCCHAARGRLNSGLNPHATRAARKKRQEWQCDTVQSAARRAGTAAARKESSSMSAPRPHPEPAAGDIVAPPADDRLGVLTATAPVVRAARRLHIDRPALIALADRWAAGPWPEAAGLDAFHF